jgi:hypothetical protein
MTQAVIRRQIGLLESGHHMARLLEGLMLIVEAP